MPAALAGLCGTGALLLRATETAAPPAAHGAAALATAVTTAPPGAAPEPRWPGPVLLTTPLLTHLPPEGADT